MSVGFQFFYAISKNVTIDMTVFGGTLVLSPEQVLVSGAISPFTRFPDYGTGIEKPTSRIAHLRCGYRPPDVTEIYENGLSVDHCISRLRLTKGRPYKSWEKQRTLALW